MGRGLVRAASEGRLGVRLGPSRSVMGVSRVGKMSQKEVGAGVGGQGGTREEAEYWTGRPGDWEPLPALPPRPGSCPLSAAAATATSLLLAFCGAAFLR